IRETEARLHRQLAYRNASPGGEVKLVSTLHNPAGCAKLRVNFAACFLLGRFGHQLLVASRINGGRLRVLATLPASCTKVKAVPIASVPGLRARVSGLEQKCN